MKLYKVEYMFNNNLSGNDSFTTKSNDYVLAITINEALAEFDNYYSGEYSTYDVYAISLESENEIIKGDDND